MTAANDPSQLGWDQWREAIVTLLRTELSDTLRHIGLDDVEWDAWRCLFEAGHSPQAAVNRALERDL
jgi:hypothetical protein